ncbi:MAG: serine protease [Deltaproteobacteria bacterium]|jgi:S1-C subfamily serine protease|nr:serine protease [Deltaproteobacteria bacterium]
MTQAADTPRPEQPAAQAAAAMPPWRRPLFWSLLLLLLLALLAGWTIGTQWQAVQARNAELAALAEKQRARNEVYEAERARLKSALEDDPCKAEGHLRTAPALPELIPDPAAGPGQNGEALRIPPPQAPGEKTDVKPDARTQERAPPAHTAPLPPAREIRTIADLMEQATVMVLSRSSRGTGMGSGFFIAPDLVFTNAHVAMEPSAQVFVCNKATGSLLPGRVAAFNASGGRDYALIRLDAQPNVRPLALKDQVRRTDRISAWGFPGAVTGGDPKFLALLRGDSNAAPEVVFTEGSVSVVLERKPPLIVHSAVISQGNSGGPLVDEHGAVLGINTLIRLDDESYRQSSLALTASDMIAFLKEQGVAFLPAGPAGAGTDAPRAAAPPPAQASGGKE